MWSLTFDQLTEIAKIVGLVSAGVWTAWTFHRLQKIRPAELANNKILTDIEKGRIEIEKSRVDTEKERIDIETSRVDMEKGRVDTEKARIDIEQSRVAQEEIRERIRSMQPQLAVQLDVSEAKPQDNDHKTLLIITVILSNEGSQHLWIGFNEYTLTIGRMIFGKNGRQRLANAVHLPPTYFAEGSTTLTPFLERILRVGQTRRMTLAVPVTVLGSYLIQFSAIYARVELIASDDEKTRRDSIIINAVVQSFYTATGKPATLAPLLPVVQNS